MRCLGGVVYCWEGGLTGHGYSKTVFRKDSYPTCGVPSPSGWGGVKLEDGSLFRRE